MALAILLNDSGSEYTIHEWARPKVLALRLRQYFKCEVRVERASINGEHDWKVLRLPRALHVRARAYAEGWRQGQSDGLDLHYGRPCFELETPSEKGASS